MKISLQSQNHKRQATKPHEPPSQWENLINKLIRPPRHQYRPAQLGPVQFEQYRTHYHRHEQIIKHEGKNIDLTIISPENINHKIILYLHGNSSSKLQALTLMKYLPAGYSLGAFDFLGCGNNQQANSISLGVRESEQISTVVSELRKQHFEVILWGRSMGAASALKYGKVDIIVADSSFRSMKKLCKEYATKNKPNSMPNCMIGCLFPCVFHKLKSDIKQKADFDLDDLNIEDEVKKMPPTKCLIFIIGDEDALIDHQHSVKLYENFQGKNKYLELVKGGHNSKRPDETVQKIMTLIEKHSNNHEVVHQPIHLGQIGIKPVFS